ncbi:MAG: PLP-dependent aminotransferase family protein [Lachnospiraceae bacterium]|nr:PLP-dependent aminotransferase family protein [Lachnospiraceae bacterium]
MNYKIDTTTGRSAYLQLYRELADDIVAGVYPYGTKLPSKRIIAAETNVSVITVQHALDLLSEEGYIEPKERSGNFVIFKEADFQSNISRERYTGRESHRVSHPFGEISYDVLSKTMRKVILDSEDTILVKSPNHGSDDLREEICAYLARSRGLTVSPKQIIIGSGAEYLYGLVAQLFGAGSVIGTEDPSYDKIGKVYSAMGLSVRKLKLLNTGISKKALFSTDAKAIHVTPFNSFPSGITVGISKKLEYLKWAEERDGFIVEDNYDSELTVSAKPEDALFSLSGGKRVIYINTFSKTVAPSLRMGYMVLPLNIIDEFDKKLGFYSCTVPIFEQLVVAELLRSGNYERHINKIRREKRKMMQQIQ